MLRVKQSDNRDSALQKLQHSSLKQIRKSEKVVIDQIRLKLEQAGINSLDVNEQELVDLAIENGLIDEYFVSWLTYILDCERNSDQLKDYDPVVLTYLAYKCRQISNDLLKVL